MIVLTTKDPAPMAGVIGSITFKTVLIPLFVLFVFEKVSFACDRNVFGGLILLSMLSVVNMCELMIEGNFTAVDDLA
jgi:hypothetical protein